MIWSRVLQYSFGNTDLAVSTVLAVFMGGLALGAFIGGRYAERFSRPVEMLQNMQARDEVETA